MNLNNFFVRCSLCCCLWLMLTQQHAQAFHLVGGEISYECIGENTYQISMSIYRDCYCTNCALFDMPANIGVMDSEGNFVQQLQAFDLTITPLEISTEGLCLETAPDVCVERGFYTVTATLPPIPGGYQIVYQRCCRNSTIVNILDPTGTGSTYVVDIPEADTDCSNSSPFFVNYPPIVICANNPLVFDHSAIDYDGDSLVYAICTPYEGANNADPAPTVPYPYGNVIWNPPYSSSNPLGGTPAMTIDPQTGLLTAFPDAIGQFVVGICVSEYRNGELLGTKIRDFQFNVADCDIVLAQATAQGDATICLGESVALQGEIFGGTTFSWSPTTGLSNSNDLNPIATPTQTTSYILSVTNPLTGCSDTDTVEVTVVQPFEVNVGNDLSLCSGNIAQLNPTGNSSFAYQWTPSTGLNNPNIPNPVAMPTQSTTYNVLVTDPTGSCSATDQITITVGQVPVADAGNDVLSCSGGGVTLDASGSTNAASFAWTPAESLDNPNSSTPLASPNQATTYTLVVTDPTGTCSATDQVSVVIGNSSDPGDMSNITQYLCDGNASNANTIGAQIEGTDVLAYVLHTNPNDILGSILAVNPSTGTFAATDNPAIQTNTMYYISAVAGPAGSTANVPDFEHPCTVVAAGTPVVFLRPVSFVVNEACDWAETGDYTVTIFPQGGLPQYDATQTYDISGTSLNETLAFGQSTTIVFPSSQTPNNYDFTATDLLGCQGAVADSFPICIKTPIELLRFEGSIEANGNLLTWTTASETNNDYFSLMRSTDGINFQQVAQIMAAGNSFGEKRYQYFDNKATYGTSYYRLLQTDYNHNTSQIATIVLQRKTTQQSLTVLPVPASEQLHVYFAARQQQAVISILDMTGKEVWQQQLNTQTNEQQHLQLPIEHLSSGIYWLYLQEGTHWQSLKWVKQ